MRHEVSYAIVLLVNHEARPAIQLAVPYVVMRDGNVSTWKPTNNVPTVAITGIYTARGSAICIPRYVGDAWVWRPPMFLACCFVPLSSRFSCALLT